MGGGGGWWTETFQIVQGQGHINFLKVGGGPIPPPPNAMLDGKINQATANYYTKTFPQIKQWKLIKVVVSIILKIRSIM